MDNAGNLLASLNLDSKGFKQLLDSQSLVDCTLACDGGKISAHKVVLSACSSYLAEILLEHPVEHPIIILPELNIDDVKTLVHYMYTGELLKSNTILHSASLLRTAAILSVNSLNDFLNGTSSQKHFPNFPSATNLNASNAIAANINDSLNLTNANPFVRGTGLGIGAEGLSLLTNSGLYQQQQPSQQQQQQQVVNNSHINISSSHSGTKSEFQFKCPVCQNDFQTICSFEYHMQRTHNVTSFGCEICHKPFASLRYVLTDHMRRCHGWKAEQKLQC